MKKELKDFLTSIINNNISLGSEASKYNRLKARRYLNELQDNESEYDMFEYNSERYDIHDTLYCVLYDNI